MKPIEERIEDFRKTLEPFEEIYPVDMLYGSSNQLGFFEHWTQLSRNGKSFKQEKETTWALSARLKTWARNNKNWYKHEQRVTDQESRAEMANLARQVLRQGNY